MKLPQPAKGINLGRALVWPSHFGASICDNSLLRVSQTLLDSFRLLGKLHWFPYVGQSSFLEPSVAAESFRVPPTLYILLYGGGGGGGEFEQYKMKRRVSIKDNTN